MDCEPGDVWLQKLLSSIESLVSENHMLKLMLIEERAARQKEAPNRHEHENECTQKLKAEQDTTEKELLDYKIQDKELAATEVQEKNKQASKTNATEVQDTNEQVLKTVATEVQDKEQAPKTAAVEVQDKNEQVPKTASTEVQHSKEQNSKTAATEVQDKNKNENVDKTVATEVQDKNEQTSKTAAISFDDRVVLDLSFLSIEDACRVKADLDKALRDYFELTPRLHVAFERRTILPPSLEPIAPIKMELLRQSCLEQPKPGKVNLVDASTETTHRVFEQLCRGVKFPHYCNRSLYKKIQILTTDGFDRAIVLKYLSENPYLTVLDVIMKILGDKDKMDKDYGKYYMDRPIYM